MMMSKGVSFRCIYLGLLLTVEAIDMSTFAGQAETRLLLESVVGMETTAEAGEMLLRAKEEPDYTCTATKRCNLGCCGPL